MPAGDGLVVEKRGGRVVAGGGNGVAPPVHRGERAFLLVRLTVMVVIPVMVVIHLRLD